MKDKRYILYLLITIALATLTIKSIWFWNETKNVIINFINVLKPFIIAIFISYIFSYLINIVEQKIFKRVKSQKVRNVLSIITVYCIAIILIISFILILFPYLLKTIKNFIEFFPQIQKNISNYVDIEVIQKYMKEASTDIQTIISSIISNSVTIAKSTYNIFFGFILSIYFSIDRKRIKKISLKIIDFLIKNKDKKEKFLKICRESDDIFKGFVINKTIDSIIIGILCLILCLILKIPYAGLISLIVGVTNMIPYFGPFIGGVPIAIILAFIDFKYGITFSIMIICLQQFDGIWLGPKLLKKSTGMGPVFIIFSISIGGMLGGPIGMFLGVPIMSVIQYIILEKLSKKQEPE